MLIICTHGAMTGGGGSDRFRGTVAADPTVGVTPAAADAITAATLGGSKGLEAYFAARSCSCMQYTEEFRKVVFIFVLMMHQTHAAQNSLTHTNEVCSFAYAFALASLSFCASSRDTRWLILVAVDGIGGAAAGLTISVRLGNMASLLTVLFRGGKEMR